MSIPAFVEPGPTLSCWQLPVVVNTTHDDPAFRNKEQDMASRLKGHDGAALSSSGHGAVFQRPPPVEATCVLKR